MQDLLAKLQKTFPEVSFEAGRTFFWSPATQTVTYKDGSSNTSDTWSLLHETAHALLGHRTYLYDVELMLFEVAAWQKAKDLGKQFDISMDEEYIQDCLDTYRDWLHLRATCPRCSTVSMQTSGNEYQCHNCTDNWTVSTARFCRPYRSSKALKKSPETMSQATFQ